MWILKVFKELFAQSYLNKKVLKLVSKITTEGKVIEAFNQR